MNRPCQFTTKVIALKCSMVLLNESYGSKVPGIEGLVDQTHIYQTMYDAVTEGSTAFSPIPKSEAEAPAESPSICCRR